MSTTEKEEQKREKGSPLKEDYSKPDYDEDIDREPYDFHCRLCRSQMNSSHTWQMHILGKPHQKKKAAAMRSKEKVVYQPTNKHQLFRPAGGPLLLSTRPLSREAQVQKLFNDVHNMPCVGLDYVTEIWRKELLLEPVYHCELCDADCQLITIVKHVTGHRHRMAYIKVKDPVKYEQFSNSAEKKSKLTGIILSYIKKLQTIHGTGQVHVEIETEPESGSDVDMENMNTSVAALQKVKVEGSKEKTKSNSAAQKMESKKETTGKEKKTAGKEKDSTVEAVPIVEYFKKSTLPEKTTLLKKLVLEKSAMKVDKDMHHQACEDYFKAMLEQMPNEKIIEVAHQFARSDFSFLEKFDSDCFDVLKMPSQLQR